MKIYPSNMNHLRYTKPTAQEIQEQYYFPCSITVLNLTTKIAEVFYYDGDGAECALGKTEIPSDYLIKKSLSKTDAAPTVIGLYPLEETGTYANLGNINAEAGKLNFASFDGSAWGLVEVEFNEIIKSTLNGGEALKEILTNKPTNIGTFTTVYVYFTEKITAASKYRLSIKLLSQLNSGPNTAFTAHTEPLGGGNPYQTIITEEWVDVGKTIIKDFTAENEAERLMLYCANFGGDIEVSLKKVDVIEKGLIPTVFALDSPLNGKKIVWFGTSIPCGVNNIVSVGDYSGQNKYPSMVAKLTGATVFNEAIGGTRISTGWSDSYNATTNILGLKDQKDSSFQIYSSLGHTIAEKDYLFDNWATIRHYFNDNANLTDIPPLTKEEFRNFSFERKLVKKYLTDSATVGRGDLYVIDHTFNDFTKVLQSVDIPTFGDATERMNYLGALNYFIRKIYADNPHHKIILISHYRNNGEEHFIKLNDAIKKVSKFWGIPLIDIAEKLQIGERFITSNGYWDANGIWHNSGYTFTDNGNNTYTTNDKSVQVEYWTNTADYRANANPRQVQAGTELATIYPVGTWVRDIHMQSALMKDNLHPHSDASGNYNMRIAQLISKELVNFL